MRNWKKVIGVASAAAMTAAMMMPTSVFAADETFKIGVIGPMTGDYAQYGTNVYNAAKIAADEIKMCIRDRFCFHRHVRAGDSLIIMSSAVTCSRNT